MTVLGMKVEGTSNRPNAAKVIPQTPGVWSPEASDFRPMLIVKLPEVSGIIPEEYDVMTIKIKAQTFQYVTVRVIDSDDEEVFSVSNFRCRANRVGLTSDHGTHVRRDPGWKGAPSDMGPKF